MKTKGIRNKNNLIIAGMILLFALMRLLFILKYRVGDEGMQNDIGYFDGRYQGHLGYIYYLLNGGNLIYNESLIHMQFYHPPLHYIIAAIWAKVLMLFGASNEMAVESIQILSLIYSIFCFYYIDKIVRRLNGRLYARIAAILMFGLFPYAILQSGAINNDSLLLLLLLMTIDSFLEYLEAPTWKGILKTAIYLGLGAMTKLSAFILVPGIIAGFVYLFVKNRGIREKLKEHMLRFAEIVAVLGLWYPLKNALIYHMPLLYVQKLQVTNEQYIGNYSILQRFFDFSTNQLASPGVVFYAKDGIQDHNIFFAMIKNAAFGESHYYEGHEKALVLILMVLLSVVLLATLIIFLCFVRNKEIHCQVIGIWYAVMMLSYFVFCIRFPHICSMNIRYIMVAITLSFIGAGIYLERRKTRLGKYVSGIYAGVFGCTGLGFYMMLMI